MRCAVCGSTRVVVERKKEGFNQKKGMLGGMLFGTTGAIVGGASGNETIYYHCGDCGHTLNKCMHQYEEMELDFALNTQVSEDTYFIDRVNRMKNKYPNAGWNLEKINQAKKSSRASKLYCDDDVMLECQNFIKANGKTSSEELTKYMQALGYKSEITEDIVRKTMRDDKYKLKLILENNTLYYEFYDSKELIDNRTLNSHNWLIYSKFTRPEREKRRVAENEKLQTIILNIVKNNNKPMHIVELMEADERIAMLSPQKIQVLCIQLMDKKLLKPEDIIDNVYNGIPRRKNETIASTINEAPKTDISLENQKLCQEIYNVLKEYGSMTVPEMMQKSDFLSNISHFKLRALCRREERDGKLICLDEKTSKFSIVE